MESFIALAAAGVSASAALVSAWFTRRTVVAERLAAADDIAVRFREPLLHAAFDLQARIYNIVRLGFLQTFMTDASPPEERTYASENTLYLLGQYFCWVEILRRESQFLDARDRARNRAVSVHLEKVRDTFAKSELTERVFRIFRGEQRAIGEVMLVGCDPTIAGSPRWDCCGYAAFVAGRSDEAKDIWFRQPRRHLAVLRDEPGRHEARLVLIQHALLDLVDFLDRDGERVSGRMRVRL